MALFCLCLIHLYVLCFVSYEEVALTENIVLDLRLLDCVLSPNSSIHLSFILHTTWVLTMAPAGYSWRWELTAIPRFPRQLLPEPQQPLPEFFSFFSSPFSCLCLSNNPPSPMGTILVCMGVGTTPGAGETSHEPYG